jgi:asparagine synthase (glutamine-hydrolysing)
MCGIVGVLSFRNSTFTISESLPYSRLGNLTSWNALQPIRERFEGKVALDDIVGSQPPAAGVVTDARRQNEHGRQPLERGEFHFWTTGRGTSFAHGTLKCILKKSVRGLIPDELIDRKKQGFDVPIYEGRSRN